MTDRRRTLFISDLHLDERRPEITHYFLQLLKHCDSSVDALYILGDLFEAWIGDDDDTPFHREVIQALKAATEKNVPIYFLFGNRDFLIGKKFLHETGCKLLSDEEKINLYGTPVLLMHGDTLCTRDTTYLKMRKISRNHFLQFLFLLLPLTIRRYIAKKLRAISASHTQSKPAEIMDVTQNEVEQVMKKHGINTLIHGHTHHMGIHQLSIDNRLLTRIVLDAWHHDGSALIWDEKCSYRFLRTPWENN